MYITNEENNKAYKGHTSLLLLTHFLVENLLLILNLLKCCREEFLFLLKCVWLCMQHITLAWWDRSRILPYLYGGVSRGGKVLYFLLSGNVCTLNLIECITYHHSY